MKLLGKYGLLEDIKLCLRYSDWMGGLPFRWNEKLNQLEIKSPRERRQHGWHLKIAASYLTVGLIQTFRVYSMAPLMAITHTIFFLGGMLMLLSFEYVNFEYTSQVVQLCNCFIQLEKNPENPKTENKRTLSDSCLRCIIFSLTFTAIVAPIILLLDTLRNPCFPAFAGYWICSQCEEDKPGYYSMPAWSFEEVMAKVGISITSYYVWGPVVAGGMFQMCLEYVMEGSCFRVNILKFGE